MTRAAAPADCWTAADKDEWEDVLHGMVCGGTVDLDTARRAIMEDWTAAYDRYVK